MLLCVTEDLDNDDDDEDEGMDNINQLDAI